MSVELDLAGGRGMRASAVLEERNRDRRFFTGMAIAAALTVFVGFAPTYYVRGLSEAHPLSPLVHLHGIVSTAWILLFLSQTSLVAARRTDLHRRLGIAGVVLASACSSSVLSPP
jgi:phosphatidylserine synthase